MEATQISCKIPHKHYGTYEQFINIYLTGQIPQEFSSKTSAPGPVWLPGSSREREIPAPWPENKTLVHRLKIGSVTNGFMFYFQSHSSLLMGVVQDNVSKAQEKRDFMYPR